MVTAQAQQVYNIQKALKTAIENSVDLQIERYNVDLAATDIVEAKTRANINVENEVLQFAKQSDFEANTKRFDPLNRDSFWKITKPIEWFGQRNSKIKLAETLLSVEESNYLEAVNGVYAEVANKWLEVWTVQQTWNDLRAKKKDLATIIGEKTDTNPNNDWSATDQLQIELYSKQFDVKLKKIESKLRNAKKQLSALLGVDDEVNIELNDIEKFVLPIDLEVLLDNSIENRPDYLSASRMLDALDYNIKLQKKLAIPQPDIGVLWSNSHTERSFGVTFAVDLPFFDRNQSEIQRSQLMKKQAELVQLDLKDEILEDIETAYDNYKLNASVVKDYEEILKKSDELDVINKAGENSKDVQPAKLIELMDAHLEIRNAYYDEVQNLAKSYIHLLQVSGQLSLLAGDA